MDEAKGVVSEVERKDQLVIEIHFEVMEAGYGYNVSAEILSLSHGSLFTSCLCDLNPMSVYGMFFCEGKYVAKLHLPSDVLREGDYAVKASAAIPAIEELDKMHEELIFKVKDWSSPIYCLREGRSGVICPILKWDLQEI